MIVKEGRRPRLMPFDMSAIERDAEGILRYTQLPSSLNEMLAATVQRVPDGEALVELGGERVSYQQLWDRSARVAGGLRAAGIRKGDRVAIRLPNGNDWQLPYFRLV